MHAHICAVTEARLYYPWHQSQFPADEGRKCGWQIDWKIILSLIHHPSRFIVLFLFNLSAGKRGCVGVSRAGIFWLPGSDCQVTLRSFGKHNVALWKIRGQKKRIRMKECLGLIQGCTTLFAEKQITTQLRICYSCWLSYLVHTKSQYISSLLACWLAH